MNKLLTTAWGRVLLALIILLVDFASFFAPLTAIVFAVVLIARPKWFKRMTDNIYRQE